MSINLTTLKDGRRAVVIRTSDSISFKSCRRKWAWSSHLKSNLGATHLAGPLWFGSAIHYALEDFHGYNHFGSAEKAFKGYCIATAKNYVRELPTDYAQLYKLGEAMMNYYQHYWLEYKPGDATYWCEDEKGVLRPQVEVNFEIPIPTDCTPRVHELCRELGIDTILYRGTIDRVGIDSYDALTCIEYKTAAVAVTQHYLTDPQVSRYLWALGLVYDKPVSSIIYMQFVKKMPEPPRILASGKVSTASNLTTSYPLYRERLIDLYGSVEASPSANQEFLLQLSLSETEDRDKYIRRDKIYRTSQQVQSQYSLICLELEDMLNPDLPLYPNPTRDCSRMCSFLSPCVSIDDGGDWEQELEAEYTVRDLQIDRLWRRRLPDAKALLESVGRSPELREEDIDIGRIQRVSREAAIRASIEAGDFPEDEFVTELAALTKNPGSSTTDNNEHSGESKGSRGPGTSGPVFNFQEV